MRALVSLLIGCTCLAVWAPAARPEAAAPPAAKVTLDLKDVPLRQALQKLFQDTKLQLSVNADVPDKPVVVKIRDVDFETALRIVTRVGDAEYRKQGDQYTVQKRTYVPNAPAGSGPFLEDDLSGKLVTMDLDRVPIRQALRALFERAQERYRVRSDVPYNLVSIHVTQVDFVLVLQVVCGLAGATYTNNDGTYVIRRAP
jgi:type II secretory pathway component HofQ